MIEVEVKAHVTDFKPIRDKLSQIGARTAKFEHQEDLYFNAPHRDFRKTDEALRIRKVIREGRMKIVLTYKGAKLDETSKTRKEIEVVVEEVENMALILESLGFRLAGTIKKDRTTYNVGEFIVTLDKVYEVGNFVEIEKDLPEGEDFQNSLNGIFSLYRKLDIEDGFERRSYLELLEQGRNRF